jgi:type I restriction enzyme S subunit
MIKKGYKQTEIGAIPKEWGIKKINEVSSFVGSGVTPKGGSSVYHTHGIPFIRSQNVYPQGLVLKDIAYIDNLQNNKMKRTEVQENDVLLNITGVSIGRCTYVPIGFGKGNVNQHVCIIRTNGKIESRFLSAFINSPIVKNQIDSFNGGSSREGLNFQQVRKIVISLPTISEQKKIADILSAVDKHIEEIDAQIRDLTTLKKVMMQKLLTEGIGHTEFKDTEVGRIPKEWAVKKFANVCPLQRGFDLPKTELKKGKYSVVYSNGILNYHNEFKVKGPGVVTGRSGTLGKVTFVCGDFWPHNTSLWVTDFFDCYPRFIYYLLCFIGLDKYGTGTGVPTLNRNVVHETNVALPPISEQKQIASILSAFDDYIEQYQHQKEGYIALKKGLMQKLLTGQIRVKI